MSEDVGRTRSWLSAVGGWFVSNPEDPSDKPLNLVKRLGLLIVPASALVAAVLFVAGSVGDGSADENVDASGRGEGLAQEEATTATVAEVSEPAAEEEPAAPDTERTPPLEVVYWIGARSDALLASTDPASLVPEQFVGLPIVESPGDWLMPSSLPIDRDAIECRSSACDELTDDDLQSQRRTLWLLVANSSDETLMSIAIDWSEIATTPVDLDGPFDVLRGDGLEVTATEQLIDLGPGDVIMVPIGTVIRLNALAAIRSIPLGDARVPLGLSFALAGETERRDIPVREPSETVVSEGYDTTAGERIGVGG